MSNHVHQAQCHTCGVVLITSKEITLYMHPSIPELGTYQFRCPGCYALVVKAASSSITTVLQRHGVKVVSDSAHEMIKEVCDEWASLIHGTDDLFSAITEGGE